MERPLQSLTIQDGTITILTNREKNVSELLENFQALVTEAIQKFEPKKLFLCDIPPLRIYERNKSQIVELRSGTTHYKSNMKMVKISN